MIEARGVHARRCILHHIMAGSFAELGDTRASYEALDSISVTLDRSCRVITDFNSLWLASVNESADLRIFIPADSEDRLLSKEREEALVCFLAQLCRRRQLKSGNIYVHSRSSHGEEIVIGSDSGQSECSESHRATWLAMIREKVSACVVNRAVEVEFCAEFEVLSVEEAGECLVISGWVSNLGSSSWVAQDSEWRVNMGIRLLSAEHAVLSEHRYSIPECGVKTGEGFAFTCQIPSGLGSFASLDMGLVIENKFWFSNVGHTQLAFDMSTRGALMLDECPQWVTRSPMVVIEVAESATEVFSSARGVPRLVDAEQPDFYAEIIYEKGASISNINEIIRNNPQANFVFVDSAIEHATLGWLRRLVRALYARSCIAACSGLVRDPGGRVADLGGSLYSTGYTVSPGYGARISDPTVLMTRGLAFLPQGIVSIRGDAVREIGMFREDLTNLRMALIEWCYRARSRGFSLRLEHSCQGVASEEYVRRLHQPPIARITDRKKLMRSLGTICPEVFNV